MIGSAPIPRHTPLRRKAWLRWKPRSRQTKTRTILYGKPYTELRRTRASMAHDCCENCGKYAPFFPGLDQPYFAGQLAHLDRGFRRNSVLDRVLWLCPGCHRELDGRG
jgi:hypothetical protein